MEQLADLRGQIDEIDTQIHDLLMKRAGVIQVISAQNEQAKSGLRPGREAQVLRRLVRRHAGVLPKAVVVRIWREIFASSAQLGSELAVSVYAPESDTRFYDLAREHFGMMTPIRGCQTVMSVLREVTDGQTSVGVLPLPFTGEDNPWWLALAQGEAATNTRIIARLPFYNASGTELAEAVIVAQDTQEATGADRSYVVAESGEPLSRSTLKSLLDKAGLPSLNIQIHAPDPAYSLQLIEVDDYVAPGDTRLAHLGELSDQRITHAWTIGGYAVPLTEA
ncbi:chorismate mutase [Kiloniella laminariae]|uniref:chorismate mutase n=1 Tax=Kiloniella laminariae TaxID=454162 RepID=UPI00036E4EC0|nr:chorismate mutase [Kiloniella laminariae]